MVPVAHNLVEKDLETHETIPPANTFTKLQHTACFEHLFRPSVDLRRSLSSSSNRLHPCLSKAMKRPEAICLAVSSAT